MTRLPKLVVAAPLALVLLSGCGADLHPGAAATVGSDRLSQVSADRTTRDVCTVLEAQSAGGGTGQAAQLFANSALQASVVQSWVQRSMADQLGDLYGVAAGTGYQQSLTQTRDQLDAVPGLDSGVRDRVLPVFTGTTYFVDVLTSVGRRVLGEQGTASPTDQAALTQGIDTAQAWAEKHPIETSPRLPDIELGDDSFNLTPDHTSVAVSAFAKDAAATQPDQDYLGSLPATQVCG